MVANSTVRVPLTVVCWPQGRACSSVLSEASLSAATIYIHTTTQNVNVGLHSEPTSAPLRRGSTYPCATLSATTAATFCLRLNAPLSKSSNSFIMRRLSDSR